MRIPIAPAGRRSMPWAVLPALLWACQGNIESALPAPLDEGSVVPGDPSGEAPRPGQPPPGTSGPVSGASCTSTERAVGPSLLRRLTNLELQLTLQDLFQRASPPGLDGIPADNDKDGFKTFAEVQPMSAQHLRAYADKARELADELFSDAPRKRAVIGCDVTEAACLRGFVERFGRLAYRRTLTADELDSITARAKAQGLDADDQLRYAIQSLLVSANFLYRIEIGDKPEGLSTLRSGELASRLSFALWGRGPSLSLLQDAEAGKLDTADGLHEVASRMLTDARARHFYAGFFRQWLGYELLRAPQVKPAGWSDAVMPELQRETDTVLDQFAFGTGSVLDALTSNQTVMTPTLAAFYGLPAPQADGKVSIPAGHPRAHAGVLGHASLLSLKSDGDMIALRGNWVRRTFFCSSLHIPPEIAADLGDLLVGLTRVEIVKKRNTEAACKGCHALIDPIGVGLAGFDATGRFDPSADIGQYGIMPALPGVESPAFDSLASLAAKLQASPEVSACLTEKVFLYVSGRAPERDDDCTLDSAADTFVERNHAFRDLLGAMVDAPSFRLRRAAEPTPVPSSMSAGK